MAIYHSKTVTVADGTATSVVRPSDWNSGHAVQFQLEGNTLGASTVGGADLVLAGGSNVTLSAVGQTLSIVAAGGTGGGGTDYVFANGNGVTFGTAGSTVTASVQTNYLTTAAQSDHSHGNPTLALTNLSGTTASNSAGFTLSLSAAAGGTGGGGGAAISAGASSQNSGTIIFSNASGVSFGLNAGTLTASVATNYQTTTPTLNQVRAPTADATYAMGSNQVQFQFSNVGTFSTNANRQGLFEIDCQGNLTDGADVLHVHQSDNDPTIDMVHIEGWGTNVTGLRLQMSASIAAEINKPLKFTHTATSAIGTVPFILGTRMSNSVANLNANYLQGKVSSEFQSTGAYLTTAANSTHTHGSGPSITGSIGVTSNSSAWSISIPAFLTTAALSQDSSKYAGTVTGITGSIGLTANTSGISVSVPAFLTTAANSTHSHGNPTLNLTNINGTTASASNGLTLSLSAVVPAQTVQPVAYSAGNGSALFSTLKFADSLGVSWSTGTQGVYVASLGETYNVSAVGNTTQTSSGTYGTALAFSGAGAASIGVTGNTVIISAPSGAGGTTNQTGPNIAAGGVTVTNGTVVFSNANGVSFGLAGSTMTASAGGGATMSRYWFPPGGQSSLTSHNFTSLNSNLVLGHMLLKEYISFSKIGAVLQVSAGTATNSSGSIAMSLDMGIYQKTTGVGQWSLMSSANSNFSASWTTNSTSGVAGGPREFYVTVNGSLAPGEYVVAQLLRFGGTNLGSASATLTHYGVPAMSAIPSADGFMVATAATANPFFPLQGVHSLTTHTAVPNLVAASDVTQTGTAYLRGQFWREFVA